MFTPQLNLILLHQPTDALNGYPSPVYPMLHVNWSAFLKSILQTLQIHDWKNGTNWIMGTWVCSHWCVIGHCVGVMAAHGVSQTGVFATSNPTPSHLTPSRLYPTHPCISYTYVRKGQ